MKLLYATVIALCLLLPPTAGGSVPSAVSPGGLLLFDGCHVRTKGGNLNVRSGSGKIIGKLPNGTRVRILSTGWAPTSQITATVGGRKIQGWVATEFLADCD